MYSRVTQLEIDTLRVPVADVVGRFRGEVLPLLQEQEGYDGTLALTTPEGKALLVTLWDTAEAADRSAAFAAEQREQFVTVFRTAPGREHYEVAVLELVPGIPVG